MVNWYIKLQITIKVLLKRLYHNHYKVYLIIMMKLAQEAFKKILGSRERVEKVSLKHVKNRGGLDLK